MPMICPSKARLALAALGAAITSAALPAAASLTIDLRLANPPFGLGPKGGTILQPAGLNGQKLTIDVYAIVQGARSKPHFYGLKSIEGSVYSEGSLRGDLQGWGDEEGFGPPVTRKRLTSFAPFNAESSQRGIQQDLDGDGDLDLGAPPGGQNQSNGVEGFIVARAGGTVSSDSPAATPALGGLTFHVGRVEFTITDLDPGSGDAAILHFVPRQDLDGSINSNAASWYEVDAALTPATGTFTTGLPITIGIVPEPGACTVAAATLAAAAMRRRTHLRSLSSAERHME